jgi:hypothetical protein
MSASIFKYPLPDGLFLHEVGAGKFREINRLQITGPILRILRFSPLLLLTKSGIQNHRRFCIFPAGRNHLVLGEFPIWTGNDGSPISHGEATLW